MQYAFSLSAAPAAWNGISDGLVISLIDATSNTVNSIQWKADVSNVLVPAPSAVTLETDTRDDCCGTANAPCTGTYDNYDNQNIAGCGTGYRLASPNVQDVAQQPLLDYVTTSLSYGGRYTSVTGGTSLAGVAVTGGTVMSQVDVTSTGPNGAATVSWYVNGYQVFTQAQVTMSDTFFIGVRPRLAAPWRARRLLCLKSTRWNCSARTRPARLLPARRRPARHRPARRRPARRHLLLRRRRPRFLHLAMWPAWTIASRV